MDVDHYKRDMETLEHMLEEVDKRIQDIVDRMANRALLSYPNEYLDTGLRYKVDQRIVVRANAVLEATRSLRSSFQGSWPTLPRYRGRNDG